MKTWSRSGQAIKRHRGVKNGLRVDEMERGVPLLPSYLAQGFVLEVCPIARCASTRNPFVNKHSLPVAMREAICIHIGQACW
eukprot:s91_g36.t1